MIYPINKIRSSFPMLKTNIIYLDNASSTYKPISVINTISNFYKNEYSSLNKGTDYFSINNFKKIEEIRKYISKFINVNYNEIIFTKGSTEGLNLIANSIYKSFIKKGDNIIISSIEHHSNILPWYNLSKENNIKINIVPIQNNGILNLNILYKYINNKTKLISITQISNVLGIENPIIDIIQIAKSINKNVLILIDGSQAVSHIKIDIKKINCDFYVFSGHKIYSSYGIGVLYGKNKLLTNMTPYEVGGSIIKHFEFNKEPVYLDSPWKFEPGSINIPGIFSLKKSIDFIKKIGLKNIINWEKNITNYALHLLKKIPNIIIYGNFNKVNIISFNIKNINYYDIGYMLNKYNISIRVGNHCSIPLMSFYNTKGMCRISFALYTNYNDIDFFIEKLNYIIKILKK